MYTDTNTSARKVHSQHVKYIRQHVSYTNINKVRYNKNSLNKLNKKCKAFI